MFVERDRNSMKQEMVGGCRHPQKGVQRLWDDSCYYLCWLFQFFFHGCFLDNSRLDGCWGGWYFSGFSHGVNHFVQSSILVFKGAQRLAVLYSDMSFTCETCYTFEATVSVRCRLNMALTEHRLIGCPILPMAQKKNGAQWETPGHGRMFWFCDSQSWWRPGNFNVGSPQSSPLVSTRFNGRIRVGWFGVSHQFLGKLHRSVSIL